MCVACGQVDFNAGVVAAGEAQIESTVTGNASPLVTNDPSEALRDRAQVFLPTNNALSPVGHVHWYLEELGQGIQHIASRVASLPAYVQRANDMRRITGEGVTFLNIPRTYYGLLEPSLVAAGLERAPHARAHATIHIPAVLTRTVARLSRRCSSPVAASTASY